MRVAAGYGLGYGRSRAVDPIRLRPDEVVRDPSVPLGGPHGGVPEDLPQRFETPATLEPSARERVTELVNVERLDV